jgi:hypothetical protein
LNDPVVHEGISEDQKALLRKKKRYGSAYTEAKKWRNMYKILFPDDEEDDIPSPCTIFSHSSFRIQVN